MEPVSVKIMVSNNQDTRVDSATHIHSNGDFYKRCDEHEYGCWLNYNPLNGFWTKSMLRSCNEGGVLTEINHSTTKPTKFVKVEESIFDLRGEFERGELYFSEWGEEKTFAKIKKEHRLMNNLNSGNVYRQVEIDWRDEVKRLDKSAIFHDSGDLFLIIDTNSNDFISMCHEIASLTEKPTN